MLIGKTYFMCTKAHGTFHEYTNEPRTIVVSVRFLRNQELPLDFQSLKQWRTTNVWKRSCTEEGKVVLRNDLSKIFTYESVQSNDDR